jgi:hypothetical protein
MRNIVTTEKTFRRSKIKNKKVIIIQALPDQNLKRIKGFSILMILKRKMRDEYYKLKNIIIQIIVLKIIKFLIIFI